MTRFSFARVPIIFALLATVFRATGLAADAAPTFVPDRPNVLTFPAQEARFVRFVILATSSGQACIDELEIYAPDGKTNLALAGSGAKAAASSCLPGYPIHKIEHLNDGHYGNGRSWIAAGDGIEWAQIELPAPAKVGKVVFSRDRDGRYQDRMPLGVEIRVSLDGHTWRTATRVKAAGFKARGRFVSVPLPQPLTQEGLVRYAFLCEREAWGRIDPGDHLSPLRVERPALPGGEPYWGRIARLDSLTRTLTHMEEMLQRLAAKGLDVEVEREQLAELLRRQAALAKAAPPAPDADFAEAAETPTAEESLYLEARLAKRNLMFRDPDLEPLTRILFAKRHPYLASHNYSDVLDSQFRPGGGICVLEIPRPQDRLDPAGAKLTTLFDAAAGIARDPVADFAAAKIYFAFRPAKSPVPGQDCYWHLMEMATNGSGLRQISDGPFHDYYPCSLPDGDLAFISTRCKCRFLCWRPQAFVLFRMKAGSDDIQPLSFANLSEWTPTVMRDGRILWTRSEYLDKGANFGHTLWAIRPDGAHPELVFGNNTINCYMNGREVPGTREIVCTLVSHGGDHNGPIGLVDLGRAPFDSAAVTNITPDVTPQYDMNWLRAGCCRDPAPVSRDYFLVSHAPADRWGLYVIDRYGNRELLYLDPEMGSMSPTPLRPVARPPVLRAQEPPSDLAEGQFIVTDVYRGLPQVARGKVKYLRVCEEVRSNLDRTPNGEFRKDHGPDFMDFYASPVHKVNGPFGWPSYVAKASLGLAPVEDDGSANFYAPAGKVLYFEALDEDLNEVQRMRSVVQLQPGELRSCVGCHEDRKSAPPVRATIASRRAPSRLGSSSWGAEAFSYEKIVQPVWDAKCVRCHDANDKRGFNLTGARDGERVPASYRTLISGGWVHYFNWGYGVRHQKAESLTFGTVKSKLWPILDRGHYDVKLTRDEMHRIKCWTDLNCPLWPDYTYRPDRPGPEAKAMPPKR
jgi:hypothetical protein